MSFSITISHNATKSARFNLHLFIFIEAITIPTIVAAIQIDVETIYANIEKLSEAKAMQYKTIKTILRASIIMSKAYNALSNATIVVILALKFSLFLLNVVSKTLNMSFNKRSVSINVFAV
jgi:hypothetical protein